MNFAGNSLLPQDIGDMPSSTDMGMQDFSLYSQIDLCSHALQCSTMHRRDHLFP